MMGEVEREDRIRESTGDLHIAEDRLGVCDIIPGMVCYVLFCRVCNKRIAVPAFGPTDARCVECKYGRPQRVKSKEVTKP
jgi:hypothetical protein